MPISFDVVSLYTNIGIEEAIDTVLHYADKYHLDCFGISPAILANLLNLALNNNVFSYQDDYYRQIRGLAMGSRLSGTLTIPVMDRFETTHIYGQLYQASDVSILHVDDTNTIANDATQAKTILTYLNEQHPTIKFELALPDQEGYLPILDIKMKILDDGTILRKHYAQPANKGITLHYNSHHPSATKRAVAASEWQRATRYSTGDNMKSALEQASTKLRSNGHPETWLKPKYNSQESRAPKKRTAYIGTLKIPFINDTMNARIRASLKRNNLANIRLTNPCPTTLPPPPPLKYDFCIE